MFKVSSTLVPDVDLYICVAPQLLTYIYMCVWINPQLLTYMCVDPAEIDPTTYV